MSPRCFKLPRMPTFCPGGLVYMSWTCGWGAARTGWAPQMPVQNFRTQINHHFIPNEWYWYPPPGATKMDNSLLNFTHSWCGEEWCFIWQRLTVSDFQLPHVAHQWCCLIQSFNVVCTPILSLTLRSTTCKLDNSEFVVTVFLILQWMTYNWGIPTVRTKRTSGGISAYLFILKNVTFPKITRMVRMLQNLCEKFFIHVCKNFLNESKNWRHKRITECSFHTWQKNFLISGKKSTSDWIICVVGGGQTGNLGLTCTHYYI